MDWDKPWMYGIVAAVCAVSLSSWSVWGSLSLYDIKIKGLLIDRNTYKPLAKDPTSALESKMNSILLDLRRKGRLSDETYHNLRSFAGSVSCFYGLPKIHKPDTPLRPIVSFLSSPTYRLSKFLASLLKPVVGQNVHHVRNSQQFAEFIISQ